MSQPSESYNNDYNNYGYRSEDDCHSRCDDDKNNYNYEESICSSKDPSDCYYDNFGLATLICPDCDEKHSSLIPCEGMKCEHCNSPDHFTYSHHEETGECPECKTEHDMHDSCVWGILFEVFKRYSKSPMCNIMDTVIEYCDGPYDYTDYTDYTEQDDSVPVLE